MRNQGSNSQTAKAKINLCLHVTGRRPNGYHELDSLVAFADFGDQIDFAPADKLGLTIAGPFGNGLEADASNLVLRAAQLFDTTRGAQITLRKNLPVASGIGGGSADAAATLRGLSKLWDITVPNDQALVLGADVPVCLASTSQRMRGIGETLTPVDFLPKLPAVLVNPGDAVSTPVIFSKLQSKTNPEISEVPAEPLDFSNAIQYLDALRNDLQAPAIQVAPTIGTVLHALGQQGAKLARMSGSGATCFGLYETIDQAKRAANYLTRDNPEWWVQPVVLG